MKKQTSDIATVFDDKSSTDNKLIRIKKNSGIEWIGEIPEHWTTSKLLYCLRRRICDGPHETPVLVDEGIPFISIDSLNDSKKIDFSVCTKFISEKDYKVYQQKAHLEKNDILFSKAATIGKTCIVDDDIFMVWSPLAIIKANYYKINNNYLYYLLNCSKLIELISLSGSYNTQANIGMRELERVIIPLPPISEQILIVDYLNEKCSEIDTTIQTKKEQLTTLSEYKKSLIYEYVTGKRCLNIS